MGQGGAVKALTNREEMLHLAALCTSTSQLSMQQVMTAPLLQSRPFPWPRLPRSLPPFCWHDLTMYVPNTQVKACLKAAASGREFIPATMAAQMAAEVGNAAAKLDASLKLDSGEDETREVDRDSIARKLSEKEVRTVLESALEQCLAPFVHIAASQKLVRLCNPRQIDAHIGHKCYNG